jgi:hypothetical protein
MPSLAPAKRRRTDPSRLLPSPTAHEQRMQVALLGAIEEVRQGIDQPRLTRALAARDAWDAVAVIPLDRIRERLGKQWPDLIRAPFDAGGRKAARRLDPFIRSVVTKAESRILLGYRARLAEAEAWLAQHAGSLVVEITEEQRRALRDLIVRAFIDGFPPRQLARAIPNIVGLHSRWANAVSRFHLGLLEDGMTAERAARMAGDYSARLLRKRAMMIARTEVLAAENAGKLEMWRQAVAGGYLRPTSVKVWVTSSMGACDICAGLSGMSTGWDQPFPGDYEMPPAHPHCRCTADVLPEAPAESVSAPAPAVPSG